MRTKNAIKIVISSAILQVVIAISGFILPKFLIEHYGSEVNGLVSSLKQMIAYFSIVSLALGSAASVALYKPLEDNNTDKINSILSATRIFFNRTGYIFATFVSLLTILYPLFIKSSQGYTVTASVVFILGIGGIFEYIMVSKYRILLIADQKNYIISRITAQGILINTIVAVLLIYLNASIILVLIVSTIIYLLRLLKTKNYVKKLYPQVNYLVKPDFQAISGKWDAFAYHIPNMIITFTPIILITFFIGLETASIYSVYNMIYMSIAMIVSIFSAGINASFGNVMVKSETATLQKSYRTYTYIFKIISFTLYTTALILTIPFVSIYINNTDGVNYVISAVAIGFAVNGLIRSIRVPSVTLVEAAGKFKENKLLNIIEAISNVLLSIILIKEFGITGVLIAASFTALIRSLLYVRFTERYILYTNSGREIVKILANVITAFIIYISANHILESIEIKTFMSWVIIGSITFISVLFVLIMLNSLISYNSAKDTLKRIRVLSNRVGGKSISS